jgi:hypothetical protein
MCPSNQAEITNKLHNFGELNGSWIFGLKYKVTNPIPPINHQSGPELFIVIFLFCFCTGLPYLKLRAQNLFPGTEPSVFQLIKAN